MYNRRVSNTLNFSVFSGQDTYIVPSDSGIRSIHRDVYIQLVQQRLNKKRQTEITDFYRVVKRNKNDDIY